MRTAGDFRDWFFEQRTPVSTYLLAIMAGSDVFNRDAVDEPPVLAYTYPGDSLSGAIMLKSARTIIQTFEKELGVEYPFEAYRMVPVHDFVVAGMEDVTLNAFSDH